MSIRSAATAAATAPARLCAAVMAMMFAPPPTDHVDTHRRRHREPMSSDRGDVPGWVMITVMTAIVVLALIVVFKDAVISAVGNAFDSIVNYKD